MPKAKFNSGEDRFNFLLALSGFMLRHDGQADLNDVAAHFEIEPELVEQALRTLNVASAKFENRPEDLFYEVDLDLLEQGQIVFNSADSTPDVPQLTTRQASALAAGLQYLASIPEFASAHEISELLALLGAGEGARFSAPIEVKSNLLSSEASMVRKAIISKNRIRCEYLNQRGDLHVREIDPLRLSLDGQYAYLTGWCHINEALRVFRLDRMRRVEVLAEEFSSDSIDLSDYADQSYVAEKTDYEVIVEVEPEAYRLISEVQAIAEPVDSKSATVRATIRVGHLQNLGRLISRYGGAARVVSPPEARELVKNYALKMLGEDVPGDLSGSEE